MALNAQTQSLLAAERRHRNTALEEQAHRLQTALNLVTEGAEEMHAEFQRGSETQQQHAEALWGGLQLSNQAKENLPEERALAVEGSSRSRTSCC